MWASFASREKAKTLPGHCSKAGALAKKVEARLFPLLLGMKIQELPEVFKQFQAVAVEQEGDVRRMLDSINEAVPGDQLSETASESRSQSGGLI